MMFFCFTLTYIKKFTLHTYNVLEFEKVYAAHRYKVKIFINFSPKKIHKYFTNGESKMVKIRGNICYIKIFFYVAICDF